MRPTKDEYFLAMAQLVSTRATCLRRAVGCVLVNARGHVLATGYNGRAAGQPHCNEEVVFGKRGHYLDQIQYPHACPGARAASGDALDTCEALHAEQNALLQCPNAYAIDSTYVTVAPCLTCVKLLMNTTCRRIVFAEPYAGSHAGAEKLWRESSPIVFTREPAAREWLHLRASRP